LGFLVFASCLKGDLLTFEEFYNPGSPDAYTYGTTAAQPLSMPLSLTPGPNAFASSVSYAISSKSSFSFSPPNADGPNAYYLVGDDTVSATGFGAGGSNTWLSVFNGGTGDTILSLPNNYRFNNLSINQSALNLYTYQNGLGVYTDPFDPQGTDFFRIRFFGIDSITDLPDLSNVTPWIDLVNYGLANNTADNFSLNQWTPVSLSTLNTNRIGFEFDGSDTSTFGMFTYLNTPTYIAFDNFDVSSVPEPNSLVLIIITALTLIRCRRRGLQKASMSSLPR
jgi:hypothetical protein